MKVFSAIPNKLPQMPVITGANIIIHLHGRLCATAPMNKLKNEGNCWTSESILAPDNESPKLLIIKGNIGAKNDEYTSCKK